MFDKDLKIIKPKVSQDMVGWFPNTSTFSNNDFL